MPNAPRRQRARTRIARWLDPEAQSPEVAPLRPEEVSEAIDNRALELLLAFCLAPDDSCVDVGANEGRFLFEMVRRAPAGRHIAFEPVPSLAAGLRERFSNLDVHEVALSDVAGHASFVEVIDDPAYSGLRERSYPAAYETRSIDVVTARLDDLLPDGFAPRIVKIDVEGNELAVFRGGANLFASVQPIVVFESGLGASDRYGTTPEQLHDLIRGEFGLRLFDLTGRGPLSRDEYTDAWASGQTWNWLARR